MPAGRERRIDAGGSFDTANLFAPLEDWITHNTGTFGDSGAAVITNSIDPSDPRRFYRAREPQLIPYAFAPAKDASSRALSGDG